MARKKTRKPKLTRLLDNSDQIIAIVDEDFAVLYANAACCHWLATDEAELLSTTLHYSSSDTSKPANGICPPPALLESPEFHSHGAIFSDAVEKRIWKNASFTRINDPTFPLTSILIVGSGPDLPALPDHADTGSPNVLHSLLSEIKQQHKQKHSLANWIGESSSAKKVRRQLNAIASNVADCLIFGPAGCGKEHLARTIFHERNLDNADLIPVHCSIADGQLIQNSIKEWVFEQRSKETNDWLLLLDIDRLGQEAQAELLGYTNLPDFHLRILATSQNDLEELARAGDFNQELASYLTVQTIEVQPLAKRTQDIGLLAQFFIEQNNQNFNQQIQCCSDDVLEAFYEYHWPRNIEELSQTLKAAHDAAKKRTIELDDLPDAFHHGLSAARIGKFEPTTIQLDDYLASIEKELVRRALKQSKNNKSKAAELLGINRAKLLRRAAALGLIDQPEKSKKDQIDESAFTEADPD